MIPLKKGQIPSAVQRNLSLMAKKIKFHTETGGEGPEAE